jgi:hypothetical protein
MFFVPETAQFACIPKPMQVGQRFTHRKSELMHIQLTSKHDGNNIGSGLRRDAGSFDFGQSVRMMRGQLCDTLVQATKRFSMGGQY